jgi:tRNA(fMet)-specific endonuclease VapC
MIILDTDHLSVLEFPESPQSARLTGAMEQRGEEFFTTAISLEEQMRGWLAAIHRARTVHNQVFYYAKLVGLVDFYSRWEILPFEESAAVRFESLRKQRVRVGTMDLKIAAIALQANALLLTANLRDFDQVPGLRVENWLS